jgi:hypothetical protein
MHSSPKDLEALYAAMSDPDLLALARDYEDLTTPAQTAVRDEFKRRNLDPPELDTPAADPHGPQRLVTLRRYRDLSEAIVAQSLLESAGIPVYLFDANLIRLDWQLSNLVGGIRLQVESADEAAALELLAQPVPDTILYGANDPEADPEAQSETQSENFPAFHQPQCPHCGSINLTFEGPSRAGQLTSLYALGLPLPPGRATWLCEDCGTRWEDILTPPPDSLPPFPQP